jgi:hypothetical protein
MSVDQQFVTYGVLCMEQISGKVESGSCVEEEQDGCGGGCDDEPEKQPKPVHNDEDEAQVH